VLGINQDPVTIKQVEWEIIRRGWEEGFIVPLRPQRRSGRSVAVVGSGPAGLAAAQQLNRAGHSVTVFEKSDRIGGLLRYGIPDFKLEKWVIDRRIRMMEEEGVRFETQIEIGRDISPRYLKTRFDAITAGQDAAFAHWLTLVQGTGSPGPAPRAAGEQSPSGRS
jgi:glutamate synthase (NADPH/NADH) small chain